jgi:hypothetical protein
MKICQVLDHKVQITCAVMHVLHIFIQSSSQSYNVGTLTHIIYTHKRTGIHTGPPNGILPPHMGISNGYGSTPGIHGDLILRPSTGALSQLAWITL